MQRSPANKMIGNKDFKQSGLKKKLINYHFPNEGISIKATSQAEALQKLKKIKNK